MEIVVFDEEHKTVVLSGEKAIITLFTDYEVMRYGYNLDLEEEFMFIKDMLEHVSSIMENIKILDIDYDKHIITYSMPRYNRFLINEYETIDYFGDKLYNLIERTLKLGLIHNDIAFRNIVIDNEGELQWIDIDSISSIKRKDNTYIYLYLVYIKEDIPPKLYEKIIKLLESYF